MTSPKKLVPFRVILFLVISLTQRANCFLNFYMSSTEVHKLLGLDMELFYVRNGTINDKALYFVVPVPSKVDTLLFTWESYAGRPLPYSINVEVSNALALGHPKLNITKTGAVPTSPSAFSISLPCSGVVSTEVTVAIQVNVTLMPINVTSLTLTRKKICEKMENRLGSQVLYDPNPTRYKSTKIFYVAIACASAFAFFIFAISAFSSYWKNKKLRRPRKEVSCQVVHHASYLTSVPRTTTCTSSYGSLRRMPSYSLIDERSKDLRERIAELTIKRSKVCLNNVILEGTFGRVYLGTYVDDNEAEKQVIVKTATDHASQTQISLLLQEGMSLYSVNHKSILTILGVSIEDNTAPYLLYPYHNYTNMKVFLQKCKSNAEGVAHTLTTQEVVDMSLQVISAMQCLHKKHLLHKDLAARNCVIDDKLQVQIADNALSRDLFPSDYHCLGDNENRPVKWLAIESLLHKSFSTSSDVWSFGVLLWELTTLAQQPYIEIDPFEMAAYLKDGYRLAQPINCPDELFALMAYCWAMSIEERPTFTQLQACLQDFYAQLTRYV